ncbi:hypothetical protein FSOLCH5_004561 [Fusarium solani]|nr:hypothetical protein NW759_002938 [Fusarium solani]
MTRIDSSASRSVMPGPREWAPIIHLHHHITSSQQQLRSTLMSLSVCKDKLNAGTSMQSETETLSEPAPSKVGERKPRHQPASPNDTIRWQPQSESWCVGEGL